MISAQVPQLKIYASDFGTNGGYLYINKNSGSGAYASIQSGDTAAYEPLILNQSGGSVGIGTTSPASYLAGTTGLAVYKSTTPGIGLGNSSGYWTAYMPSGSTDLRFYNGSADKLTIQNGGNVGIGNPGTISQLLTVAGNMTASIYYDYDSGGTTYYLDPSNAGTSLNVAGAITTGGNITVGAGGAGKISVTTIDPVYTINGTQYSTYVPSMVGVNEEVTGKATLTYNPDYKAYVYILELNNQPVGSDVWLWSKATDSDVSLTDVLLTPDSSARVWYEKDTNSRTVIFFADKPTDLTFRLTAPRFDYASWGNISQAGPGVTGLIAPNIQVSTLSGVLQQASMSAEQINKLFDENGNPYYTLTDEFGNALQIFQSFSDILAANIQAGLVNADNVITNSLSVTTGNITINGQNIKDYITGIVENVLNGEDNNIISPIASVDQIHTDLISPLASSSAIAIQFDQNKLNILNANNASGSAVASIDNQGNASFSGQLSASSGQFGDATISGTLHAGKILASDIEGLNIQTSTISAQYITNNITNVYNSTNSASGSNFGLITGQATSGTSSSIFQQLADLSAGQYINLATYSSELAYVENLGAANAAFSQGLMVFGPTSLSDTSIVGQLSINGSLILADNSINVLGSDLNLQPLRQGGISIMSGLITIDTNGNAVFNQNATVKGTLYADVISPIPGNDLTVQLGNPGQTAKLAVENASGSAVLSLNQLGDLIASGAGTFAKLNLSPISPAYAVSLTEIVASGSAGTANLTTHQTEVTIDNPLVTVPTHLSISRRLQAPATMFCIY